eukprot:1734382-Pyramimonas_sp.AAC.1
MERLYPGLHPLSGFGEVVVRGGTLMPPCKQGRYRHANSPREAVFRRGQPGAATSAQRVAQGGLRAVRAVPGIGTAATGKANPNNTNDENSPM